MKKLIFFSTLLFAQTSSVVVTVPVIPIPAVPGKFVATAGSLNCTVVGNNAPASSVNISCSGSLSVLLHNIPIPVGCAISQSFIMNGDTIIFLVSRLSAGLPINFQVTTHPNGGQDSPAVTGTL